MRFLYTAVLIVLTPFFLMRLWWKGRTLSAYRERIAERFAFKKETAPVDIWFHAVSLGEVIAATPLIEGLLNRSFRVLVTTTTPTGSERVMKQFAERIKHQYLPYDVSFIMNRFLQQYQPKLILMMETELWPNLILTAAARNVPLILVNGRLSEQSFRGYVRARFWFKHLLKKFHSIWVQTDEDRARFLSLGASPQQVEVMGNVKFDLAISGNSPGRFETLKKQWGENRTVVIFASTHEDEEKQLLAYFPRLQAAIADVLLLIVPRHPERFEPVYRLCCASLYSTVRASQPEALTSSVSIVVLDALGELMQAYQCSDYAFVGGSLVPVGGHNVLEPIAMSVPVISGPFVHNFKSICERLQQVNAIQLVASAEQVINALIALHQDTPQKSQQVARATELLMANRGVVQHYLDRIEAFAMQDLAKGE